jgi:nucleotide-binding universal stress UspA family protein
MVFTRVIAAVDGTRAGFEAARQAARLTGPGGELLLTAVADPALVLLNRWGPAQLVDLGEGMHSLERARERLPEAASRSLGEARAQLPVDLRVDTRIVSGRPWEALREAAEGEGADLLVTGSHGGRRLAGVALGSTATELLHDAPCSVAVARPPFDPAGFPARVVVGVDGSGPSLAALDAARVLAEGGAEVTVLVARGGDVRPRDVARRADPLPVAVVDRRPVDALVEAGEAVDLLVLGARGLSGVRSLGSVSERVAHRAECSVLVVR